jgi:hypothetical protein
MVFLIPDAPAQTAARHTSRAPLFYEAAAVAAFAAIMILFVAAAPLLRELRPWSRAGALGNFTKGSFSEAVYL